jgi:hypothetical protein
MGILWGCGGSVGGDVMAQLVKGIVSRDWKGLQMVSFDRFEV